MIRASIGLSFAVITVSVNGESQEVPEGTTVADLVRRLDLSHAACAVEVNRRVVPKRDHIACALDDGDSIEVVTLVGGG